MNLPTAQRQSSYQQTTRDILAIFFIKKHVFLMTFFGVMLGAIALSFLTPPVYEAEMQLVVKPYNSKPLVFDEDSSRMNVFNEVTEKTLNTVIFMLTAPEVLREIVVTHHLAAEDDEKQILKEMASLKGRIKAEPLTMSSLIRVTLRGGNPELITAQLKTLADAYIRYHIKVNQATEGRLQFFTEQTEHFRQKYDAVTKQLAEAGKTLEIVDSAAQKDTGLMLIKDLEISKLQTGVQIGTIKGRIESLKSATRNLQDKGQLVGLPAESLASYPALIEMEKSLAQLHINRQRANNDYQPGSKQVQDAESQYQSMKTQIRRSLEQIIHDLEIQISSLQNNIQDADKKIAQIRSNGLELNGNTLQLEQLTMEQKLTKDNYLLYSAKKEEARINEEKDRARFANIALANPPSQPSSPWFPKKGTILTIALVLAGMLALAFSAIAYAMEQRLWTPTDIILHSNLRILGTFDAIGASHDDSFFARWKRKPTKAAAT